MMDISGLVSNIAVPVGLIVVCVVLLYNYGYNRLRTWEKLGVPGPPPIPFLGNAHELIRDQKSVIENGTSRLEEKYGKLFGAYMFNVPMLVVSDVEVLKEILVRDFHKYTDRHHMGDGGFFHKTLLNGLAFQNGNAWKRARKIVTPIFSVSKLKLLTGYTNVMARLMAQKLEERAGDKCAVLTTKELFRAFTLDAVMGTFFGLEMGMQDSTHSDVSRIINEMFKPKPLVPLALCLTNNFPFLRFLLRKMNISLIDNEGIEYFITLVRKCIRERNQNPKSFKRTDLIQLLLQAEIDAGSDPDAGGGKKLTLEEVEGHAIVFLIAGFETTAFTLHFLTYSIAKNPDIQNKLVEEIERVVGDEKEVSYEMCQDLRYMEAVINETLRMYPPFVSLTRLAVKTTTLRGIPVAKGTAISSNIFKLGRDPELYEDPLRFNPDRFFINGNDDDNTDDAGGDDEGQSHNKKSKIGIRNTSSAKCLAFGLGPRNCVGMKLAMLQVKIALVHVLRKIEFLDPMPNELKISHAYLTIDTKEPIKLKVAKRQNNNK